MSNQQKAAITIEKFWTNYVPKDDGSGMRPIDMVAYAPMGRRERSVITETISRLSKLQPESLAADNPAVAMAWARWRAIEPAYRAWKDGQELPAVGTALAAWSGISPEQADVLRSMGIKSVEDFAGMSDGLVSKCNFPNARALQSAAKAWLEGADRAKAAAGMANLEAENASLKSDLEEMKAIILQMQAEQAAKRGPGRPRKEQGEEAAA